MMNEDTRTRIQKLVDDNAVLLFMKGTPAQPRCGFSARVIGILEELGVPFGTVDVLSDPEIRTGIKSFSDWPTIPQLYVNKEFIGGSDIVAQMAGNGELYELVGVEYVAPTPPTVHLTDSMAAALKKFGAGSNGMPRLEVSAHFQYNVSFDQQRDDDFAVESNGVTVLVNKSSAKRADGIKLDYQDNGSGGGVVIDNPNEPAGVAQIDVFQLKGMLSRDEVQLFDVRTPKERETATIPGAKHLDEATIAAIGAMPKDTPLVFHCHHGGRSQQAAQHFLDQGYSNVSNVSGGIDAWSLNIDKSVPRY
jgi:monothiol glutaredoxin